jgi:hypothetical protein
MPLQPYFEHDGITLYHGDCREILPELESETFDMVLTDPPHPPEYIGRWGGATSSIVQTNFTALEYGTLQHAYNYFNAALFDGGLPQVLITLQRHGRARGYFSPNRFQRRGPVQENIHEVALNPDAFTGRTDEEILSTLAHEMVHTWQQEYGYPGRGRYHNREWAARMYSIGLMPSATGRPGGKPTGETVSHYILEGRPFQVVCGTFLTRYRLVWESAVTPVHDEGSEGTKQTRAKFTCPNCVLNAWAKPDALICCYQCSVEAGELVLMRRA